MQNQGCYDVRYDTNLVGLFDALTNVVARQRALQRPSTNELCVCGPATQLKRNIVDIDELET